MLFANFGIDLPWEFCAQGYALRLLKESLLKQILDLQIMLHFDQLKHCQLAIAVPYLQKYGLFLHFDLENLRIRRIE